jgi:glycine hydroxymethyltransferase
MLKRGYTLVSGGTDNHLMLIDLRPQQLNGAKLELILERANIVLNKNTVPGDVSAMNPGGVRVGTPAMTTRGFSAADFDATAAFIDRGVKIALAIQEKAGSKKMKAWRRELAAHDWPEIAALRADVTAYVQTFPSPGAE